MRNVYSVADKKQVALFLLLLILFYISLAASTSTAEPNSVRLNLLDAIEKDMVSVDINGHGSIEKLAATFTLLKPIQNVTIVVPPGTYFVAAGKRERDAFWSSDLLTIPFLASDRQSAYIPVVKAALEGSAASANTEFSVMKPSNDRIPKLLDYMTKENMSHASKQVVVAIMYDPALSRDSIDETYYTKYTGLLNPLGTTKEAVSAEDPVYAFMAMRKTGIPVQDLKLYNELVSLVHALGTRETSVREFALAELAKLDAIDPNYLTSQDYVGALIHFTKHRNRSVRYRAVLAVSHYPERRVVNALIPMITDNEVIYRVQDAIFIMGEGSPRTIGNTVREILRHCRDDYEEDIITLLSSNDYMTRYAGIGIFSGTHSERVKTILTKLSTDDEYKIVRDAALKSLNPESYNSSISQRSADRRPHHLRSDQNTVSP